MKIKTKYIILAILIVLAGLFILGWCVGHKKTKDALNRLETAQNTISHYKTKIGQDSVFIVQTKQVLASEREAKKALELTNKDLRKLNIKQANEITSLKFRVDTLLEDVGHNGIIIITDTVFADNTQQNAILLPFSFEKKDKWLEFKGRFDPQGKLDVSLKMDLSVDVITGIDKEKKPTCVLKTDNPYIKTIALNSYKTDTPSPKRYGIGLNIGYGLAIAKDKSVIASPYIGFGVSMNFLRF
jgi:hypothetical protein